MNEDLKSTGITIPYLAHENILARLERTVHRLWILCMILILILVATNTAWLFYECSRVDGLHQLIQQEGAPNHDAK